MWIKKKVNLVNILCHMLNIQNENMEELGEQPYNLMSDKSKLWPTFFIFIFTLFNVKNLENCYMV